MVWYPVLIANRIGREFMGIRMIEGGDEPQVSTARLAELLVSYERSLEAERPAAVVLADASDASLAAALAASKLLIPLEAVPAAIEAPSDNGRVIAQLASAYTPRA
jgi:hypothetical protein